MMERSALRAVSLSLTAAERLGRELGRLRLHNGLSLRKLARLVGMTAHSGLVDYERGTRIPPYDLFAALLSVLRPGDRHLTSLYQAAVAERAQRRISTTGAEPTGRCAGCAPAVDELANALEQLAARLRTGTTGDRNEHDNPARRTAFLTPTSPTGQRAGLLEEPPPLRGSHR